MGEQYDNGNRVNNSGSIEGSEQSGQLIVRSDAERSELNAKIAELKRDVLKTLKEVVDMMAQVSGVLDGTIVSAEEWCERLRRSRREDGERENPLSPMEKPPSELPPMNSCMNGFGGVPDVKMG